MSWLGNTAEAWSGPHLVYNEDRPWTDYCEQRPGVYRLIALKKGDLAYTPAVIDRVCGQDDSGTLYIGGAKILRRRVGGLIMQHRHDYKTKPHKPFPEIMLKQFEARELAVCWHYTAEGADPFVVEWELRQGYRERFGEMPPLDG